MKIPFINLFVVKQTFFEKMMAFKYERDKAIERREHLKELNNQAEKKIIELQAENMAGGQVCENLKTQIVDLEIGHAAEIQAIIKKTKAEQNEQSNKIIAGLLEIEKAKLRQRLGLPATAKKKVQAYKTIDGKPVKYSNSDPKTNKGPENTGKTKTIEDKPNIEAMAG